MTRLITALFFMLMVNLAHADVFHKNNSLIEVPNTTVTSGATQVYDKNADKHQQFTGSTAGEIAQLPDATTVPVGRAFVIMNRSSVDVTVHNDGGGVLQVLPAAAQAEFRLMDNATSNGVWDVAASSLTPPESDPLSLHLDGSKTMSGDLQMGNQDIVNAGSLSIDDTADQPFLFEPYGFGILQAEGQDAASGAFIAVKSKDSDGTDNAGFLAFKEGDSTLASPATWGGFAYDAPSDAFIISTSTIGGTRPPLDFIYFTGGTGLRLDTDASFDLFSSQSKNIFFASDHIQGGGARTFEFGLTNQALSNDYDIRLYNLGGEGNTDTEFFSIGLANTGGTHYEMVSKATGTGSILPVTLGVGDNLTLQKTSQDYDLGGTGTGLLVRSKDSGTLSRLILASADADGTDTTEFVVYGNGVPGDTNTSFIEFGHPASGANFSIMAGSTGSGALRGIDIQAATNRRVGLFPGSGASVEHSGNVLPDADDSRNLGSASLRYDGVFATRLNSGAGQLDIESDVNIVETNKLIFDQTSGTNDLIMRNDNASLGYALLMESNTAREVNIAVAPGDRDGSDNINFDFYAEETGGYTTFKGLGLNYNSSDPNYFLLKYFEENVNQQFGLKIAGQNASVGTMTFHPAGVGSPNYDGGNVDIGGGSGGGTGAEGVINLTTDTEVTAAKKLTFLGSINIDLLESPGDDGLLINGSADSYHEWRAGTGDGSQDNALFISGDITSGHQMGWGYNAYSSPQSYFFSTQSFGAGGSLPPPLYFAVREGGDPYPGITVMAMEDNQSVELTSGLLRGNDDSGTGNGQTITVRGGDGGSGLGTQSGGNLNLGGGSGEEVEGVVNLTTNSVVASTKSLTFIGQGGGPDISLTGGDAFGDSLVISTETAGGAYHLWTTLEDDGTVDNLMYIFREDAASPGANNSSLMLGYNAFNGQVFEIGSQNIGTSPLTPIYLSMRAPGDGQGTKVFGVEDKVSVELTSGLLRGDDKTTAVDGQSITVRGGNSGTGIGTQNGGDLNLAGGTGDENDGEVNILSNLSFATNELKFEGTAGDMILFNGQNTSRTDIGYPLVITTPAAGSPQIAIVPDDGDGGDGVLIDMYSTYTAGYATYRSLSIGYNQADPNYQRFQTQSHSAATLQGIKINSQDVLTGSLVIEPPVSATVGGDVNLTAGAGSSSNGTVNLNSSTINLTSPDAGSTMSVDISSADKDATDLVQFRLFAVGDGAAATQSLLTFAYEPSNRYSLTTGEVGSPSNDRPDILFASGTGRFTIEADGNILMGSAANLDMNTSDIINAGNVSATKDTNVSYNFVGDTNTGLDSTGDDTLNLATAGVSAVTIEDDGDVFVTRGNLQTSRASSGGTVEKSIVNTSNTASSDSRLRVSVAGNSAGDPYILFEGFAQASMGMDNSASDIVRFTHGLGVASEIALEYDSDLQVTIPGNDLRVRRSESAGIVTLLVNNQESTNAASEAMVRIETNGASAGDPFLKMIVGGVGNSSHLIGVDNSDGDKFKMAHDQASLATETFFEYDYSTNTMELGESTDSHVVIPSGDLKIVANDSDEVVLDLNALADGDVVRQRLSNADQDTYFSFTANFSAGAETFGLGRVLDSSGIGLFTYTEVDKKFAFGAGLTGGIEVATNVDILGQLNVDGTKVVSNRVTGWGAPTGTATRTAFDTSTATTTSNAEALKALIDDLRTHGLIGN